MDRPEGICSEPGSSLASRTGNDEKLACWGHAPVVSNSLLDCLALTASQRRFRRLPHGACSPGHMRGGLGAVSPPGRRSFRSSATSAPRYWGPPDKVSFFQEINGSLFKKL